MAVDPTPHEEIDQDPTLEIAVKLGSIKVVEIDTGGNIVVDYADRRTNMRSLPMPSGDMQGIEALKSQLALITESKYPAALAMARIMQSYGIGVRSSVPGLGAGIPSLGPLEKSGATTKTVIHSQDPWTQPFEITEDLNELFGQDHVVLLDDNKTDPCTAPDGKSQLRCYHPKWTTDEDRFRKKMKVTGTLLQEVDSTKGATAMRWDSTLSHINVMKGIRDLRLWDNTDAGLRHDLAEWPLCQCGIHRRNSARRSVLLRIICLGPRQR